MESPPSHNPAPCAETNRMRVRLLFAAFAITALAMTGLREIFTEPYPGPFMPAFKSDGLNMISPTEASVTVSRIKVAFDDGTTADLTTNQLFYGGPHAARQGMIFLVVPNPSPPWAVKNQGNVRRWLSQFLPKRDYSYTPPPSTLPDDIRTYFQARLSKIYGPKKATSMTVIIESKQFPLSNCLDVHTVPVSQNTFPLHEGT